ncbi:MAG: hypothetical protein IPJ41_01160 [Phycisphaerales bacterium]|nr:hypothetical protein [Phycisphaerales bacterium]
MVRPFLAPAIAIGSAALTACGQSAVFLVPESADVDQGAAILLAAVPGTALDAMPMPWPAEQLTHFFARTAWTQENRDTLPHEETREAAAGWPAERPGITMLGIELDRESHTVDANTFRAFLRRAVDDEVREELGALPQSGNVTYVQTGTAIALVRVLGEGPEPVSIATSETGLPGEIHALMDPTKLTPGSILAVELDGRIPTNGPLVRDRAIELGRAEDPDEDERANRGPEGRKPRAEEEEGGVLIATNATTGESVRAVANESGTAIVPIAHAGRWRLEFHTVNRAGAGAGAQFFVHTTTMTFDVREEKDQ